MIKHLLLKNIGPTSDLEAQFAPRLNLITGDNGLGKSFILDIVWWALTRRWPRDLNKSITTGDMARPQSGANAQIQFSVSGLTKDAAYESKFSVTDQGWTGKAGRPLNPGLVLYAMADGSFAAWDPARNYWKKKGNIDVQERVPAYVFSPREIWDGLTDPDRGLLCNGLVADWASWQKENGLAFDQLRAVLKSLSPGEGEPLEPGSFRRISLDDPRDIPTLKMPYGQEVPVLQVSSGMKRVIALAYLLVWNWQEHVKASVLLGQETAPQIVFIIDEVESHLHPRWQRSVIGALLDVMKALAPQAQVQVIVATHSPLVMASVEPRFDHARDAWFDLDLKAAEDGNQPRVAFQQRNFLRLGEVSRWLVSEAFDLPSARSLEAEQLLKEAGVVLSADPPDPAQALGLHQKLLATLGDTDPFWIRWRFVGERQGWLK